MVPNKTDSNSLVVNTNNNEELAKLAFAMDDKITSLEAKIESIHDVSVLLCHLREDMDTGFVRNDAAFRFQHHHRQVRILSELLRYLVIDLTKAHEDASEIQASFFKLTHGGQA